MKVLPLILAVCGLTLGCALGQSTAPAFPANGANYKLFPNAKPPLVPMPQEIEWANKTIELKSVRLAAPTSVSYPAQMNFIKKELEGFLANHRVKVEDAASFIIEFKKGSVDAKTDKAKLKDEAYSLKVNSKGVLITANDTKGFFYGMKTLEQLIIRRNG